MAHILAAYQLSERRACGMAKVHRPLYRYQRRSGDQASPRMRIRENAAVRVRHGYQRIHIPLRR